jgi:DNA-binding NarL/FixJ family response regulator
MKNSDDMEKIRVLIVDDHPFFRSGIITWINQHESMVSCGEAGSIREARERILQLKPDVVLMDLRLGDGDALDLIREMTESVTGARFLAVSQFDEELYAARALKAGARGYLMKSVATETLITAIETIMQGGIYLSPAVANKITSLIFLKEGR